GHLEPCGGRCDAPGGAGGVRLGPGVPAAAEAAAERLRGVRGPLKGLRGLHTDWGRSRACSCGPADCGLPVTRALPSRHWAQVRFQSPKPLPNGSMVSPSEFTTSTRSPSRTVSKNHWALSVLIPTQPWLTLA